MKSTRTSLKVYYTKRVEVEPGVTEYELTEKVVKAERERIFQSRQDTALADEMPINARLRVRGEIDSNINYAILDKKKYKVRSVNEDLTSHYTIIELGELI